MNQIIASCKRDLLDIYKHALDAVRPERLIKNCIDFSNGKFVIRDPLNPLVKPVEYDLSNTRLHVIGGGKCVLAMAKGVAEVARMTQASAMFSQGCLSVPIISKPSFDEDVVTQNLLGSLDISVKFGSKDNLPDEDSVHATVCILEKIDAACETDKIDGFKSLFIVLLSGGGSACLTSPRHLSLQQKTELIRRLAQRGANIEELNTVRRCFSNVKGGKLSMHILGKSSSTRVVSLILSDVINDPIDIIASGPTCLNLAETDLTRSMEYVLKKYDIEMANYREDGHRVKVDIDLVHNQIVGNNKLALFSLKERADQLGYRTKLLGNSLSGTTNEVLDRILENAVFDSDKSLIAGAGESTVVKGTDESWGVGGRTQEMALDYMLNKLSSNQQCHSENIDVFMAGSTDGQDGPTDVAGCLASLSDWSLNKNFMIVDVVKAKKAHDSYNFWMKNQPDWLVKTGPTGTNVMDLYMLMNVKMKGNNST